MKAEANKKLVNTIVTVVKTIKCKIRFVLNLFFLFLLFVFFHYFQ